MSKKQFSMNDYWNHVADGLRPLLEFTGNTYDEWSSWNQLAYQKLIELLGEFPKKVPQNVDIESVEEINNDLVRERVVFDTEEFMSVPCIVTRQKNMKADKSNAAIICVHGHGEYGKDVVAGIKTTQGHIDAIAEANYNYAEQMAQHGFLTIAPDLRGFGERRDGVNPFPDRDPCNINFIKGSIMGIYTLMLNIWDMKCCVDYLETRVEVDKNRIGIMGLSQGGTITTFTAAIEKRIKAADIIGYVNPFADFGIKDANFCGSQILPNIYKYFDTHDIAGLIAPKPLLVEMGEHDTCFNIDCLKMGFSRLEKVYKAANASDVLFADIHNGKHAFAGNKAFDFFNKYL